MRRGVYAVLAFLGQSLVLGGLLLVGVLILAGIFQANAPRQEPAYVPCPVPVWESGAESLEEFDRRAQLKLQMMRHCGDKLEAARRGR